MGKGPQLVLIIYAHSFQVAAVRNLGLLFWGVEARIRTTLKYI